jgi:hypothetical protein
MSHRSSDMASMAHPIFSLSTKRETRILNYQHDDTVVEIWLGTRARETAWDSSCAYEY